MPVSYCPFCNTKVPEGHVITCPKCLGPLHIANGKAVCSCCGYTKDMTPVEEPAADKPAPKRPKLMVEDPVVEGIVDPEPAPVQTSEE